MTETCAGSILNTKCLTHDKERNLEFTSVGACLPDIKMRITDGSNSEIVPADVVGNLEISGPVVFKGYSNNPTATEESFSSDGWFKTGDKGSIDEIGYLTLQGRAKEVLVINSVKYNPHEIETALDESKIPGLTPSFDCCFSYFSRTRGFNESNSMLIFEVGKILESNGDKLDWKECLLHLSYFLDLATKAHARKLAAELQGATREQAMTKAMEDVDQDRLFELALSPEALNK
ncbi:AMP dependent CoA ligase [Aspergillus arachidicola]|uniref:AMP dependent CoA ligase n=1 Tax=Aspergillus arachidicola TaxID=656916 RepID=A0A2G7FTW6_9EURO|nr:AMP dependent CoA ligase [Aspergillus arachidicola]